jgi:hypothetical protein
MRHRRSRAPSPAPPGGQKEKDEEIDYLVETAENLVRELRTTVDQASARLRAARTEAGHDTG